MDSYFDKLDKSLRLKKKQSEIIEKLKDKIFEKNNQKAKEFFKLYLESVMSVINYEKKESKYLIVPPYSLAKFSLVACPRYASIAFFIVLVSSFFIENCSIISYS